MTTAPVCRAAARPAQPGNVVPMRAASRTGAVSSAVTGTWTDAVGATGTVFGTFDPRRASTRGDRVEVTGCLQVHVQDHTGAVARTVDREVAAPLRTASVVTGARGAAGATALELGPLDLDVPGLHLQLDGISLDISGGPGTGPCEELLDALADLLDGVPATLAELLDEVFAGQQRT